MPAEYLNLYIDQGSDFSQTIPLSGSYNLSAGVVDSQFRLSYQSANASGLFTSSVDAGNNTVTLSLQGAVSANLASGKYVYDAVLYNSTQNTVLRLLEGVIEMSPGVTLNPGSIVTSNTIIQQSNQGIINAIIFG